MDRNTIRGILMNPVNFRPKEKDIATPYLVLPDGTSLDGELKLIGLSGKERLEIEEKANIQTINKDGSVTNKIDSRLFSALAVQACLRSRETGERIYDLVDVLGMMADGDGELMQKDDEIVLNLVREVTSFIGKRTLKEEKKDSEITPGDSDSSSSPQGSVEPLMNSLEASTAQS